MNFKITVTYDYGHIRSGMMYDEWVVPGQKVATTLDSIRMTMDDGPTIKAHVIRLTIAQEHVFGWIGIGDLRFYQDGMVERGTIGHEEFVMEDYWTAFDNLVGFIETEYAGFWKK